MSFGALSAPAIRALSAGAKAAGKILARAQSTEQVGFHHTGKRRWRCANRTFRQVEYVPCNRARRPLSLGHPSPGAGVIINSRRDAIHQIRAVGRVILNTVWIALEPAVKPPFHLAQEMDRRAWAGKMRVFVVPWANYTFDGAGQVLHQMGDGVAVAIVPSTNAQNGGLDCIIIFAN